jgi:ABC-type glutathione transport system ATPase component
MFGDRRKMNSSFYLILVCLLIAAAGKVITKVEQVTVVFGRQNFPFLKPSYKKALDSLTVSFDKSALLVAVSGPSGSGKSTLAQFVSRNTRAYSTSGNLEMISGTKVCYMDARYYLNYDGTRTLKSIFDSAIDPIIRRLLGILSIPDDISINSLAESKRKLVEGA